MADYGGYERIDASTLRTFEAELRSAVFSDDAARTEFYVLALGVTQQMEAALLFLLAEFRPEVARKICDELT